MQLTRSGHPANARSRCGVLPVSVFHSDGADFALSTTIWAAEDGRMHDPDHFSATMDTAGLGPLTVVALTAETTGPYLVRRDEPMIRRSDLEAYPTPHISAAHSRTHTA